MRVVVTRRRVVALLGLLALLVGGMTAVPASAQTTSFEVSRADDPDPDDCAPDDCSLREAVLAANALSDPVAITLPDLGGPYVLSRAGDDAVGLVGDLDVVSTDLTITGQGADVTTIEQTVSDQRVLHILGAVVTLEGVRITGGDTPSFGGGINNQGTLTITASTISGNETRDEGSGGGIFNAGPLTITASTISDNEASGFVGSGGGIFNFLGGVLAITASTISGNEAGRGNGIANDGEADVVNTTISGNHGEGLFNGGDLDLISSTVTGNEEGVDQSSAVSTEATLTSSIVAGNGDGDDDCTGEPDNITSMGSNVLGSTCPDGPDDQAAVDDPLLGDLDDNGGPTATHAIEPGSPALENGSNPEGLDFDQRGPGFPREEGNPDVGAFELDQLNLSIADAKKKEGHRGRRKIVFDLTLDAPALGGESVDYATSHGSAKRRDYKPTDGTIVFEPGQQTAQIVVKIKSDRRRERNERFFVDLSNPVGLVLDDDRAKGVIRNDDRRRGGGRPPGGGCPGGTCIV